MSQVLSPPTVPHGQPAPKRVSTAGYWVAVAILVAGLIASLTWFAISVVGLLDANDVSARLRVPSTSEVELGAGEWYVYHEYPGSDETTYLPDPSVAIAGPAGRSVALQRWEPGSFSLYEAEPSAGRGIGRFDAPVAGQYRIEVSGEAAVPQHVVFARPIDGRSVWGMASAVAVGVLCTLIGLTILVVTLIRRSRWQRLSRAAARPTGYGAAPPGPSGVPGPPPSSWSGGPPPPGPPPPGPPAAR